jgi:hypothetical protein
MFVQRCEEWQCQQHGGVWCLPWLLNKKEEMNSFLREDIIQPDSQRPSTTQKQSLPPAGLKLLKSMTLGCKQRDFIVIISQCDGGSHLEASEY